jgi:hypothetical protein
MVDVKRELPTAGSSSVVAGSSSVVDRKASS